MVTGNQPHVKQAERVWQGLVIAFDDGRCALFSPELLYSMLPGATEIPEDLEPEELGGKEG